MKNKKGFTLIELLAVIVVLAIIALIATPIVMNTIKNAKKGAAERTADNYIKQVETTIAEKKLEGAKIYDDLYNINVEGNLFSNDIHADLDLCRREPSYESCVGKKIQLNIEMNGTKPSSGIVTISNGGVSKEGTTMTVGDYKVKYNQEKNKYEATEKGNNSSTVVYRWSTDTIKIGDTIDPSDTSKFTKDPNTLGKTFYLKHALDKDNKVVEIYTCVLYNSKEYCLTNGEYGYASNEADYTGNLFVLKKLSESEIVCTLGDVYSSNASCDFSNNSGILTAYSNGNVASSGDGACFVNNDDSSYCDPL